MYLSKLIIPRNISEARKNLNDQTNYPKDLYQPSTRSKEVVKTVKILTQQFTIKAKKFHKHILSKQKIFKQIANVSEN